MKSEYQTPGKILNHFHGTGPITEEMVIIRARELAVIEGRGASHYNKNDLLQAKHELMGATPVSTEDGEEEPLTMLTQWDEDLDASGHVVEKGQPLDEQTVMEQLFEEGLYEAEHARMLAAARQAPRL